DEPRLSNKRVARNRAPSPAIQSVVEFVAHHKVGIGGNLCRFAVDGEVKVGTAARFLARARRVHSSFKIINVIRLVAFAWRVLDDLQWRLVVNVPRDDHMLGQRLTVYEDA